MSTVEPVKCAAKWKSSEEDTREHQCYMYATSHPSYRPADKEPLKLVNQPKPRLEHRCRCGSLYTESRGIVPCDGDGGDFNTKLQELFRDASEAINSL